MAKAKTTGKTAKRPSAVAKKKVEVAPVDQMLAENENLKTAVQQIEAQFGSGSIMALGCLLYTSPSPRDLSTSRMPSSA